MEPDGASRRRSRLFPRFDEAPLTVLWGPRGYGKTYLVETWLGAQPGCTVIRVDVPAPRVSTEQYWSDLAARLTTDTDVLVLDRPDRLRDETTWKRLHSIRTVYRRLRMVLMIRESDLLDSVRLPDPQLTVVTAAELEFTEAEFADLLARAAVSSPERTAQDLWRIAGGHPALVGIAVDVVRAFGGDLDVERERAYRAVRVQIDRYTEDMLLEDAGIGDMARTVAVLRRPFPDALELLGVDDVAGSLRSLERAGMVRRMPAAPDPYWTWPTALRRSILRIVERDAGEPSRSTAATLGRWFAARGDSVEALRHATDGQDWDLLIATLAAEWPTILTTGLGVLIRALQALPDAEVQAYPALQFARLLVAGTGLTGGSPGHVHGPLPDILIAEAAKTTGHDSDDLALLTGTMRLCIRRWNGDFDEAVRDRDALVILADRVGAGSGGLDSRWLASIWMHFGLAGQLRGGDERTVEFLRRSVDCGLNDRGNFAARQAAGHLALHHAIEGEAALAEHWLTQEKRFGDQAGWLRALVERPAIIARALVHLDRLEVSAAETALDELAELGELDELWAFAVYARSQLDLLRGDFEVGLDRVDRSLHRFRRRCGPDSAAGPLLTAASMDLRTAASQPARVLEQVGSAEGPMHPMIRLAAARAALCTGDHRAATAFCTPLTGLDGGQTRVRLEALSIAATLAHEQGREGDARIHWNRATAIARDSGLVRPLLTTPPAIREALAAGGEKIPSACALAEWGEGPYPRPAAPVALTPREAVVLDRIVRGHRVTDIAESLFVSSNTVKSQLRSIYRKLGVTSRKDAAREAARRGLC